MPYCLNVANGYHQICDEFDDGETLSRRKSLSRHRKPWKWVWRWVSDKKAYLCRAFGMDEEDGLMLGCCRRIGWRYVFWKIKAVLRRMAKPKPASRLRFKYDAVSYALNFDDGEACQDYPDKAMRFSSMFVAKAVPVES